MTVQLLNTTLKVFASTTWDTPKTTITVTWNQTDKDNFFTVTKHGFKETFSGQDGVLYFEFNKLNNKVVSSTSKTFSEFSSTLMSTSQEVYPICNSVIVIASSGNIGNALPGIKTQLQSLNKISLEKINSMTISSAFVFVFDCQTRQCFFETHMNECLLSIKNESMDGLWFKKGYASSQPDYESDWMLDEKQNKNRMIEFHHNLGTIPSHFILYFKPALDSSSVFIFSPWDVNYRGGPSCVEATNSSILLHIWDGISHVFGTWDYQKGWTAHSKGFWKVNAWK